MPAGDTMPRSEQYLVVDARKCVGCIACMLACSLVHEGRVCPSLSRIQVIQHTWGRFPQDISYLPQEGVVFGGDLLFLCSTLLGTYGSFEGWIEAMALAASGRRTKEKQS